MKLITPIPENYYNYPEKDVQGAAFIWGILAWSLPFSLVPFLIFANKNKFIYHHARQGVVEFVFFVISVLFVFIPKIGDIVMLLSFLLCFSISCIGIVLYYKKMTYEIPVFGALARLIRVSSFDE